METRGARASQARYQKINIGTIQNTVMTTLSVACARLTTLPRGSSDMPATQYRLETGHRPSDRLAPREEAIDALRDVREIRRVSGGHLCRDVPAVMDVVERAPDFGPVDGSLADPLPREFAVRPGEVEVLQVHLEDAVGERADPVLRERIEDDVPHVEVRLDPGGVELVDVTRELQRAEEELVPDLLDRDRDFQVTRDRHQALADDAL